MGLLAGMIEERIPHSMMQQLCPGLTTKTELVLVSNPATGDEAMYQRDGKDWYLLDAGAAPVAGAAPLSGESPEKGRCEGDDVLAGPSGPVGSLPGGLSGSNG